MLLKFCLSGFMLVCIAFNTISGIYVTENKNGTSGYRRKAQQKLSPAEWTEMGEDGLWSSILEDWTLSQTNTREGRVFQPSHKYIPTNGFYITKRMGEAQQTMELEPHMRPPGKVIAAPGMNVNHVNSGPPTNVLRQNFNGVSSSPREVSETDLYLLGAIEKLVYRVDYMEKRLRRTEQMVYYLMAGNSQKEGTDPCADNFTRVGKNCYHFGTHRDLNWKSASAMCKSLGGHLAEFETITENQDMIAFLLNHPQHKGKDFWLGGLNPGLLWIWTNSAKPVNPNTNLTSISNTSSTTGSNSNNSTIKINATSTKPTTTEKPKVATKQNIEIKGNGRCLRYSYNPALHTYGYTGQDCSMRYHYMCESEDRTLDNEISRIAKELNLQE